MVEPITNPYIGPRPFKKEEWELFFGRRREAASLLSLVLRNRLVLFCAPSGAGKTSLLNTTLRRDLERQGFEVLPIVRVGGNLPSGMATVTNVFAFNLILALDGGQHPAPTWAQTTLAEYFRQTRPPSLEDEPESIKPYVVIIDQFEEIFTSHPEYWQQRADFFEQLREAMQTDRLLWVVLAMRAEYIAGLDRYAPLVPGQLSTRFFIQGLEHAAALEAIEEPAKKGRRPFEPSVARKLVDNLCLIKVRNQQVTTKPGEFIEPVQLQVVCQQLWEAIKENPGETIRMADVERVAGKKGLADFVDNALGRFYNEVITKTVEETVFPELDLRRWVEERLITPMDTRGLVVRGPDETEGLLNHVIDVLEKKLLIHRAEVRSGGDWYELIHDRLITAVRTSNLAWYEQQQPLVQMAREWDQSGRHDNHLLEGLRLKAALSSDWRSLGSLVEEFLAASQALQERREAEQQKELAHARELAEEAKARHRVEAEARQKLRRRAIGLGILATFALIVAAVAVTFYFVARTNSEALLMRSLATEADQSKESSPQSSLLLTAETISWMQQVKGSIPYRLATSEVMQSMMGYGGFEEDTVRYLHKTFNQVLENTAGIPLRDQNGQVAVNIKHLAVSPDRQWAAAGSTEGVVHVWSLAAGYPDRAKVSLPLHSSNVMAIAFSPDNQWLATGGRDGLISLIDLTTPAVRAITIKSDKNRDEVQALAFHPQESWLAVGRSLAPVQRLDLPPSDQPLSRLLGSDSADTATLAFSPDGLWLATVSTADTLQVWPLTGNRPITESRLLSKGKNGLVASSPDGRWLAVGSEGTTAAHLYKWHDSDAPAVQLEGIKQGVRAISFSQDGEFLFVGSDSGAISTVNMADVDFTVANQSSESTVSLSPEPPPKPAAIDEKSPAPPPSKPSPKLPSLPLNTFPEMSAAHRGAVRAVAFFEEIQEGKWLLASVGDDHALRLWNSDNVPALQQDELYGHDAEVTAVFFGSTPTVLLTKSEDGTVRFWDLSKSRSPQNSNQLEAGELQDWIDKACQRAGRDFTEQERKDYFSHPGYTSTCAKQLAKPDS